jgi:multidrug efflux pump subunit AcrA (membrane-fusion protein)
MTRRPSDHATPSVAASKPARGTDPEALPELGDEALFRDEAVLEKGRSPIAEGDLVRIAPWWARIVYLFLCVAAALGALYVVFGSVSEYASGPAIVRQRGETMLNAVAAGVVEAVVVRTGAQVRRGDLLVRLSSRDEQGLVDKLQLDFDHELIALLRNPGDSAARAAVGRARADLELAKTRLELRFIRAPSDGFIHDIRVRAGESVETGAPVGSLVQVREYEVVALIPGRYGPLLQPGQVLNLRLAGFSDTKISVEIHRIGDAVVGPTEARRYIGADIGDAVAVSQPVILVHATLPKATFEADERQHPYYSGLVGTAEIRVGDERILFSLLPWTKTLQEKWHGW